jgi:hypothetical protein
MFSLALAALILTAQVGLPMHFHYCKGTLESVSLLFKNECKEDAELTKMPACCKKITTKHCRKNNDGCCHNQVKLLSQDITSVAPAHAQLFNAIVDISTPEIVAPKINPSTISPFSFCIIASDTGPPIYIRYHSLIYYA